MWKYAKLVTTHGAVVSCIPLDMLRFIAQSHLTLRDPHGLQPTSVHGIVQARTLEWATMPSSRIPLDIQLHFTGHNFLCFCAQGWLQCYELSQAALLHC